MKNTIIILSFLLIFSNFCHAFDLDMTVDDDIRKNYNPDKLIQDTNTEEALPSLPEISKYEKIESKTTPKPTSTQIQLPIPAKVINGNVKISKGSSFDVTNSTKINDWLAKGNTVRFYNRTPIVKRNYTIPANTYFTGEIIEVHQPQISCNGGLVVIRVKSMVYKGQTIPINAYITRADDKMIFLNNIKGKRTYLKTVWSKGNWGRTLFGRMLTLTINLGGEGSTVLLSPFPLAYGTICLGLNTLTSPITAFFSKGGHVSIPANSSFRIKFLDDTYVD